MRIEVSVEPADRLKGSVRVVDGGEPAEPIEFTGWLELIHTFSRCMETALPTTSPEVRGETA